MKTANNNPLSNVMKRLAAPALFSALLLLVSTSQVLATDPIKKSPVEITYIGNIDQQSVFQLSFENPEGDEVFLTLKDVYGNVIYTDVIKDKKYSRKIALDTGDVNDLKVILSLKSKKNYQTQTFQINKNVRYVEHVEVSQL